MLSVVYEQGNTLSHEVIPFYNNVRHCLAIKARVFHMCHDCTYYFYIDNRSGRKNGRIFELNSLVHVLDGIFFLSLYLLLSLTGNRLPTVTAFQKKKMGSFHSLKPEKKNDLDNEKIARPTLLPLRIGPVLFS